MLNMLPALPVDYSLHMSEGYAVLLGYFSKLGTAGSQGSDTNYIIISKRGHAVTGTLRPSALRHRVVTILSRRPEKYVRRIAAPRVVTLVAGEEFSGIDTVLNTVRSAIRSPLSIAKLDLSVPARTSVSQPRPARIRPATPVHTAPELINLLWGKMGVRHLMTSLSGRGVSHAGGASTSPGFSLPGLYTPSYRP